MQPFPPALQPAFHGADRPAKPARRLLETQSLQAAQHDGQAVDLLQSSDFFIERGHQLTSRQCGQRVGTRIGQQNATIQILDRSASGARRAGLARHAASNRMQERGQRLAPADGCGLAGKDEEGGLQAILGRVGVGQHPPAHQQHHGPITPDEPSEGGLVALVDEALQKVGIRSRVRRGGELLDVVDKRCDVAGHVWWFSCRGMGASVRIVPRSGPIAHRFWRSTFQKWHGSGECNRSCHGCVNRVGRNSTTKRHLLRSRLTQPWHERLHSARAFQTMPRCRSATLCPIRPRPASALPPANPPAARQSPEPSPALRRDRAARPTAQPRDW